MEGGEKERDCHRGESQIEIEKKGTPSENETLVSVKKSLTI